MNDKNNRKVMFDIGVILASLVVSTTLAVSFGVLIFGKIDNNS